MGATFSSVVLGGSMLLGNVIAPHHPHLLTTSTAFTANDARGLRVVIPRDGVLRDLAVWVANQSGNLDIGVYNTASGTAGKLYSSTSVACGAAAAWQVVGDPNLTVHAGDHLDLVLACDNAVATFARVAAPVSNLIVQLPANYMPSPLGASPKTAWRGVTSFPLPPSFTEAAKTVSGGAIAFIMGRLT